MINFKDVEVMFRPDIWQKLEALKEFYNDRHSSSAAMATYRHAQKEFKILVESNKIKNKSCAY